MLKKIAEVISFKKYRDPDITFSNHSKAIWEYLTEDLGFSKNEWQLYGFFLETDLHESLLNSISKYCIKTIAILNNKTLEIKQFPAKYILERIKEKKCLKK